MEYKADILSLDYEGRGVAKTGGRRVKKSASPPLSAPFGTIAKILPAKLPSRVFQASKNCALLMDT